ncbi:Uma2 family endonuclease [bacterium]|nr:Uma2 family endonuclease [bacterium]
MHVSPVEWESFDVLAFSTENGYDQRMGTVVRQTLVSEQDYLVAERDTEIRHEFVDGVLFAMVGASRAHNLIATNLVVALSSRLRGSGCRVSSSDMKVRLAEGRRYYYPDIVVSCTDVQDEPDEYSESAPVLIVEILSPSTALTDKREKRMTYQSLPSLIDYLLVSQDKASVERFTRDENGWTHATFNSDENVELTSIGMILSMDDIYTEVMIPRG